MSILGLFVGSVQASREADFWQWFQRNETMLFDFERDQERIFDRLAAELRKVHPQLTFEFGPKRDGRRECVISADGIRAAFPGVESLFAAAPALPKWKIIKFRPRREPFDLEYEGVSVRANTVSALLHPDGSKAGVTLLIPGYSKAAHKTYMGIAFLLLDQALGEFDVETRVGVIDVRAPSGDAAAAISLRELPLAFDRYFTKR